MDGPSGQDPNEHRRLPPGMLLRPAQGDQNAKVAIPSASKGLQRPSGSGKARTTLACEFCRQKRVKCDGGRPSCGRCTLASVPCVYAKERRNRSRELQQAMENMTRDYRLLTQQLTSRGTSGGSADVRMQDFELAISPSISELSNTPAENSPAFSEELTDYFDELYLQNRRTSGQAQTPSQPTSMLDEDGYSADTYWVHRLAERISQEDALGESTQASYDLIHKLAQSSLYLVDVYGPLNDDAMANPHLLPDKVVAEILIDCFLRTIHSSYPIVDRALLNQELKSLYSEKAPAKSDNWLAMLNIIFAISAAYAEQTGAEWGSRCHNHVDYFSRAKALGLSKEVLQGPSNFDQLQLLTLTGLYFFTISRFRISADIISLIFQLGYRGLLSLKAHAEISGVSQPTLTRFWAALYCLEVALHRITGTAGDASSHFFLDAQLVTFLGSVNEYTLAEAAASKEKLADFAESAYLAFRIRLCRVLHMILDELYKEEIDTCSDELVQQVRELDDKLQKWKILLPSFLDFELVQQEDTAFARERLTLAMQFFDSRGLIHRPFLHLLSSGNIGSGDQLASVIYPNAEACVMSARDTIATLPADGTSPNTTLLLEIGPWWAVLPYLVTANIIFTEIMLSGLFASQSRRVEIMVSLQQDAQKAVNLLEALAVSPGSTQQSNITSPRVDGIDSLSRTTRQEGSGAAGSSRSGRQPRIDGDSDGVRDPGISAFDGAAMESWGTIVLLRHIAANLADIGRP